MASVDALDRPTFAPAPQFTNGDQTGRPTATPLTLGASSHSFSSLPPLHPKGLQLGTHRMNQLPGSLETELEEEEHGGADAWGDGDLMDVNADDGDWGAFSAADSATTTNRASGPKIVVPKPVAAVQLGMNNPSLNTPSLIIQGMCGGDHIDSRR